MKNANFIRQIFVIAVCMSSEFAAHAKTIKNIPLLSADAHIDGKLEESVWHQATKIDVNVELQPANNHPAEVQTQAFLYQNGEALFVAIKAHDQNSNLIRAGYKKRDDLGKDDRISITIDTFNSLRRAFKFEMNPYGVQSDEIYNELGTNNKSWNTLWLGAGDRNEQGYTLEFKIPFSSMRFPLSNNKQTWRIEIERHMPRDSEIHIASSPKQRGNGCFLCQTPVYTSAGSVKSGTNMQLVPTLVINQTSLREEGELLTHSPNHELSFDGKWDITADNILNVTVNPDFSQVEADASTITVNNTFSPSFAEKRPFFLEGSSFFKTSMSSLVHTRNIVAPEYGVKLTGQTGKNNYAILAAKDEVTSFILPQLTSSEAITLNGDQKESMASKNLILRYNQNFQGLSNMGMLITSKSSTGYKNNTFNLDGNFRPSQHHKLSYEFSHSETQNPITLQESHDVSSSQSGSGTSLQYDFSQPDYQVGGKFAVYDKDFRADLSKHGQVGHNFKKIFGSYNWYAEKGNPWTTWGVYADWDQTYKNGGVQLNEELESHYFIRGPMQFWWKNGFKDKTTYWQGKHYDEFWLDYHFAIDPTDKIRVRWLLSDGERVDFANNRLADYVQESYGADWRAFGHLTGNVSLVFQEMSITEGKIYQVEQLDIRATWQFDLAHSLKVVLKHSSIKRNQALYIDEVEKRRTDLASQFVYSWAPTPITVLHAGFSNNSFKDEFIDSLRTDTQSVFLKFSYGFQL